MSPEEKAAIKTWVRAWQQAGPILGQIRHNDIRNEDSHLTFLQLAPTLPNPPPA
jgi:hypothetical protein